MNDDRKSMPGDWDALVDRSTDVASPRHSASDLDPPGPPPLTLMASAWADLVGMLAVCTAALVAILVLGERPALPAFAWAAALGFVWWAFAAATLVVIRQATRFGSGIGRRGDAGSFRDRRRASLDPSSRSSFGYRRRRRVSAAARVSPLVCYGRKSTGQALRRLKTMPM
jgi:hypothetical protein